MTRPERRRLKRMGIPEHEFVDFRNGLRDELIILLFSLPINVMKKLEYPREQIEGFCAMLLEEYLEFENEGESLEVYRQMIYDETGMQFILGEEE